MTRVWFPQKPLALLAALVALPLAASAVLGADEPNPIVTAIKAQLKDPDKPFTMFVRLQVKDGMQAKFEAAFAKAITGTRKEKGNLAYDLNRDAKDPTRYVVYERWKSLKDLDSHLKQPYLTALLAILPDMLTGAPEANAYLPAGE